MRMYLVHTILSLVLIACSEPKTIIIDGKVQSQQLLNTLDKSEIYSFFKWKKDEAPPWYRNWNDNTLIVVKTKAVERKLQKERFVLLGQILDSVDKGKDILLVKDGTIVPSSSQKELRNLSEDQLSNVNIINLQEAKKLYGSKAKSINLTINLYGPDKGDSLWLK